MQVPTIERITAQIGGEVHAGRHTLVPDPGRSTVDRSPSISINGAGFDVPVCAGDDPIECKNVARQKLRGSDGRPSVRGQSNGRGRAQAVVDAMTKAVTTPIVIG